ncbi:L10-interacting MYB domain-containing protein [Camellia lanceoleosa]|uniref:L10-interacting MYB domain-containing protein n=1 Tax=Camellia lanceoleosa TaxID=1840588 RepID=A0ACC0GH43_9ERIC|nr:L10-interacting MYB domain-containing protein [Camellia lanceoleosa]
MSLLSFVFFLGFVFVFEPGVQAWSKEGHNMKCLIAQICQQIDLRSFAKFPNHIDLTLSCLWYTSSGLVEMAIKVMASTTHIDLPIDDDDVVEVGRGNSSENSGPWPHRNESLFITLIDEEVKTKNSKITGTFTKQAWNRLRDQMNAKTQYQYNAHQLRNKYNQLRIMFNKFTSLLKHTGVGWDSQRLTITAPDDVWEALYKVNTHAKRFRKKGMVYYHELSRILGDTSATGKLAFPFTKSPSESSASSDPEFKVKNEELDALQIDSDNDNGDGQGKGKSKSKMRGKKSKKRSSFRANILKHSKK